MKDIPGPWYMQAAIWAARLMRKWRFTLRVIRRCKDRLIVGPLMRNHHLFVHSLRDFALNVDLRRDDGEPDPYCTELANACCEVIADMLYLEGSALHCTIKLVDEGDGRAQEDWSVSTIARSSPCDRPAEYRPTGYRVGDNSSFAAILGCADTYHQWTLPYACFSCNDLLARKVRYANSREKWQEYYLSTFVLPLRVRMTPAERNLRVIGFLTFDSPYPNTFTGMPSIFKYVQRTGRDRFHEKLKFRSLFQQGAAMADSIATVIAMKLQIGG